jgi:hypothetical protein
VSAKAGARKIAISALAQLTSGNDCTEHYGGNWPVRCALLMIGLELSVSDSSTPQFTADDLDGRARFANTCLSNGVPADGSPVQPRIGHHVDLPSARHASAAT